MHTRLPLPPEEEMYRALVACDGQYEGLFIFGVRTTGVFCRPTCPARKPLRENVRFFPSASEALAAGFRACRRCRPLEADGAAPDWLRGLLDRVESDPTRRWTDADLRAAAVAPSRVRRWFKQHHGMTFHAYLRARRLAAAVGQIHAGEQVTGAAFDHGYESLSGFREALKKWLGDAPRREMHRRPILVARMLTPLGPMIAAGADEGLYLLEFADRRMLPTQFRRIDRLFRRPIAPGEHPILEQTRREVAEYFEGRRTSFDLPLRHDGTDFQQRVWKALLTIPYGETVSYRELAKTIQRASAQRAVGRANGDNRFAIVIPCHRVVRSDGTLCGYGGGLWRKQWLLEHERRVLAQYGSIEKPRMNLSSVKPEPSLSADDADWRR
ncbi:MAG: methylated-DNA--[protein]-cysteine S-methyltransferase [Pirellulaceae bacterium]